MLRKVFVTKSNHILIQMFRYTFVAAIGLVVDFGVLYVLTEKLGVYYLISATISFVFALLVNYILSVLWIFESTKDRWLKELVLFGLIGIMGLFLNILLIWLFTAVFHTFYLISKAISTTIIYFWNFFLRRYLLFNNNAE